MEFPISVGCHFFFDFLGEITRNDRLKIYTSLGSFEGHFVQFERPRPEHSASAFLAQYA